MAIGALARPFSQAAAVENRGYSCGLQRVMTDFGAEVSFAKAAEKVAEHYGIEVPESAVRNITLAHAEQIKEAAVLESQLPQGGVELVIGQTDGCLLPLVKTDEKKEGTDKRKARELLWKEARLSLARKQGALQKHYQATLAGVAAAGSQWLDCTIKAGAGLNSWVHCVGDGATWIVKQVEEKFQAGAHYLLDFYHLSEYLWAAAEKISEEPKAWLHQQQARLKQNQASAVLAELAAHLENPEIEDSLAPVRVCWRYLNNRLSYVDYQGALEADLPIGSGEIESANRSVIQARLKISGAWWKEENAEKMLRLRALRASGGWQSYWDNRRQAAA